MHMPRVGLLIWALTTVSISPCPGQESPIPTRETIQNTKAKAVAGDPDAQYQMALYHHQGVPGVMEKDPAEGTRWLSSAAERGSKRARVMIAASIFSQATPEDARQRALKWLEEGRAQHDVPSILVLADIYERGSGGLRADADKALTLLKENAALPEIANALGEVYFRGGLRQSIDFALAMQYFQSAADKGYPEGIKNVGKLHYMGRGRAQDCEKAYAYFKKAADLNNLHAIYDMGLLYKNGCGVAQDYAQAIRWFQKASDLGHLTAREALASAYAHGRGVARDERRAYELYQSLGEKGSPESLNRLARIHEQGIGVEKNPALAFQQKLQASRQGSVSALVGLGCSYRDGRGTPPDIQAALDCFKKAALTGDADAKYFIGCIYDEGKQVKRDPAMAAKWYADSIREDSAALKSQPSVPDAGKIRVDGFTQLGILYYRGEGVPKDIPKAVDLFRKGAAGGAVGAMRFLAGLYERGDDIPADMNLALDWYGQAAAKGDVASMFHLGTYHMTVSKDYKKAIFNFARAGEKNHPEAFFRLGYMQTHGWGCPVDVNTASESYKKADALGFSYAKQAEVLKQRGG